MKNKAITIYAGEGLDIDGVNALFVRHVQRSIDFNFYTCLDEFRKDHGADFDHTEYAITITVEKIKKN